jgi:hypothetical protein
VTVICLHRRDTVHFCVWSAKYLVSTLPDDPSFMHKHGANEGIWSYLPCPLCSQFQATAHVKFIVIHLYQN